MTDGFKSNVLGIENSGMPKTSFLSMLAQAGVFPSTLKNS